MKVNLFLCVCQNILLLFGRNYPSISFVHLFTDIFMCVFLYYFPITSEVYSVVQSIGRNTLFKDPDSRQ